MKYEIRIASMEEIELVHQTMMLAFEEYRGRLHPPSGALSENTETILSKISEHGGGALLVWSGDKPVGSAQYFFRESFLYVGRLSVIPEARGQGLGKAIMKHFEKLAAQLRYSEIRLGVRLSLPENLRFYRKLGYEIAEEHEYPERTDGWYIMSKQVRSEHGMISKDNVEHYVWGNDCDGWRLVDEETVSIIHERMPPGTSEQRHYHARAGQFFFVLFGTLDIEIEGTVHTLSAHQGMRVQPGAVHQVMNRSAEPVEFMVYSQPNSRGDRTLA
ncbi:MULTISPECIES: GNAT family N-acetyltransferase [Paenibacillus]|uniref:GNAT family N-acetyltransferase n=1 Tax=Paenibacillus TaxID=44249 RepID=UPI0011AB49E5|nr:MULTISPECIES: GNAT family N-acetyltransferase [Paenibacillus]